MKFTAHTYTHSLQEIQEMEQLLRDTYSHDGLPSNWWFGRFQNWYYTHNLHPTPEELKKLAKQVRLWRNEDGKLVAYCLSEGGSGQDVHLQIHPDFAEVAKDVIQWIVETADGKRVTFIVEEETERIELLKEAGFENRGHCENSYVYDLREPMENNPLPEGYTLKTLADLSNFDTFFAAKDLAFPRSGSSKERFQTKAQAPDYHYEWNILVIAPDGQCAAFLTVWPDWNNKMAEIDPVGTHPNFQKKGLAKAMLSQTFHILKDAGIEMVYIGTGAEPFPANFLYQSLQPAHKYKGLAFVRDI